MSNYHIRVITLHYDEATLPKFKKQEEIDAWHQAVGRMVCYGLQQEAEDDTIQLVTGGITANPLELDLHYYAPLPPERHENGDRKYVNTPSEWLNTTVDRLVEKSVKLYRGITIGAVLHSDGHWGFHS